LNFSDAGYVAKLIGGIAGKKEGIGSHVLQQILAAQNSAVTQSASTEKAVENKGIREGGVEVIRGY